MAHYSKAQLADQLDQWAREAASRLIDKHKDWAGLPSVRLDDELDQHVKPPLLMYSGMSGISSATALSLAVYRQCGRNIPMVYVRKDGERSHGSRVEHDYLYRDYTYTGYFVDDFIDSGDTRHRVITEVEEAGFLFDGEIDSILSGVR